MSAEEIEWPFESIESAYDYMDILATTTLEVMSELKRTGIKPCAMASNATRKRSTWQYFMLKMLGWHVYKGRRMLNDLRILRRLILNERLSVENARRCNRPTTRLHWGSCGTPEPGVCPWRVSTYVNPLLGTSNS